MGVNQSALTAGSYQGTITVNVTGLGTATIQVTLTVGAGAPASLSPNQLSFAFQTGGSNPPAQLVQMSTQGGQQVSFTAAATSTGNWLQVTPQSGSAPGFVAVSVNPANLTPANYSGTVNITLAASSTPIALPVTFSVSATAVLRLSLNNAALNYQIGDKGSHRRVHFSKISARRMDRNMSISIVASIPRFSHRVETRDLGTGFPAASGGLGTRFMAVSPSGIPQMLYPRVADAGTGPVES
ncbi:MAG: BACON domain-containing protein [Acidobacteria bacterium]|nr:BACON domain-containing protein [Acidobacteriota bacterium]